jgi:hypothetical protein
MSHKRSSNRKEEMGGNGGSSTPTSQQGSDPAADTDTAPYDNTCTPPTPPNPGDELEPPLDRQETKATYTYKGVRGWRRWRALRPGRGMYHDVRRRLPYYGSDIADAWTYRTVASTIRMYFVKCVCNPCHV